MPTNLPLATHRKNGLALGNVLPAAGLSLVAVCALLVIKGLEMRAVAEAQEARVVEDENRAFCSKFGIGPETGRYSDCAAGLSEIRTRYLQRRIADSIL